jgi:hypothetical protein
VADAQSVKWRSRAIGEIYYANTSLAGVDIPPADMSDTVWIELTAGLTGAGGFNAGKLRTETVSGAAPLVSAFATIDVGTSPLYNRVVRLLNTEGRILRPSTSPGTVQDDAFQSHKHNIGFTTLATGAGGSPIAAGSGFSFQSAGNMLPVTDGVNGMERTANETRVKNIGVKSYMRIA